MGTSVTSKEEHIKTRWGTGMKKHSPVTLAESTLLTRNNLFDRIEMYGPTSVSQCDKEGLTLPGGEMPRKQSSCWTDIPHLKMLVDGCKTCSVFKKQKKKVI